MDCIPCKRCDASRLLYAVLSRYPIVSTLASHLTSRDFVHLTLANRTTLALLRPSKTYFQTLNQACMCDGLGVLTWRACGNIDDENRMVRMVNQIADCQVVGRPCDKCGIVICEECCAYPAKGVDELETLQDPPSSPPFHPSILHSDYRSEVMVAMCQECDVAAENWVHSNTRKDIEPVAATYRTAGFATGAGTRNEICGSL